MRPVSARCKGLIISAEREAVAAKAKADKLALERSKLARLLAEGKLCANYTYAANLGPTALTRLIQDCMVADPDILSLARYYRLDPGLIAKVVGLIDYNARASYNAMLEQQEKSRAYIEAHQGFNWNAWGNSVAQDLSATTDATIANQRKTYYENLEKWNRGQQNWDGPK